MAPRILVVDRNEAFATMLKEMLELDGGYEVDMVHAGSEALKRLPRASYDLTIIDMDLDAKDMGSRALVEKVRGLDPRMRLVLIPLMGADLSPESRALDIQGTLSKPFFVDDLLPKIQEALTKKVGAPVVSKSEGRPISPAQAPLPIKEGASDVQSVLVDLVRETSADAVFLLSKEPGQERIVAHTSSLDKKRLEPLAYMIFAAVQSAQAIAHYLGQPDQPFEHNMFENKSLRLYIMALPKNLQLVIVTPLSTPLGTIRHNLRRAVRQLGALALT